LTLVVFVIFYFIYVFSCLQLEKECQHLFDEVTVSEVIAEVVQDYGRVELASKIGKRSRAEISCHLTQTSKKGD